jgi:hypothetical protein
MYFILYDCIQQGREQPITRLSVPTSTNSEDASTVASELTSPTWMPMEHSSIFGDDGSEIDLENNNERNFSSRQEEDLSQNKHPGRGNTRHEHNPTHPEVPKTYLPAGMLEGITGSNSDDVISSRIGFSTYSQIVVTKMTTWYL